jgi:hypothetical protein
MKSTFKPRIILSFFLIILSASQVLAQLGFYEGYIVTNQNDSVFGKIGAYQKKKIIEYCILKKDGEEVKYYPNMIQRFGFTSGSCFVTKVLRDTIAQVLVEGKLSLYKYQTTLYIRKDSNKVQKLETYTNRVMDNGKMYYVEDIKWKGIITYLTSDCNIDPNELKKLQLLEVQLTEFVVNYNKCANSKFIEYKNKY